MDGVINKLPVEIKSITGSHTATGSTRTIVNADLPTGLKKVLDFHMTAGNSASIYLHEWQLTSNGIEYVLSTYYQGALINLVAQSTIYYEIIYI